MDLDLTNLVRPQDERPARRDGTCFYCQEPIGQPHKPDCVCLQKSVVVRVTLEVVMDTPRYWNGASVDFHLNGSSWCADNFLDTLIGFAERTGEERPCLCGAFKGEFLREATAEDHEHLPVLIDPSEEA